jgi:hypothetical protein
MSIKNDVRVDVEVHAKFGHRKPILEISSF